MLLRNILSRDSIRGLQDFLSDLREEKDGDFITWRARPVFAAAIGTRSDPFLGGAGTAIVLQGPLMLRHRFTLQSVLLYRQHYPEADIIVSTWKGESADELAAIEDAGARVVLSSLPPYAGISNTNYQIVSTRVGIEAAKAAGNTFALKTRTDQRVYAPSSLEFLHHLVKTFPVNGQWKQKHRIVGHSLGTFKYRLYGLSDMFLFGDIDDLLAYWQCPLDDRRVEELPGAEDVFSHSLLRVCEVYFCSEYLRRIGRELRWTLADSYAAFADHFVVANTADFDLYWQKYGGAEVKWTAYQLAAGFQPLDFREWLNIHCRPSRHSPGLEALKACSSDNGPASN